MNADGLVIEGTYMNSEKDMAREFAHLTAHEAATLAANANIGHLYLTHISRRYRDKDVEKEAREVFPNTTIVHDFDQYTIKK